MQVQRIVKGAFRILPALVALVVFALYTQAQSQPDCLLLQLGQNPDADAVHAVFAQNNIRYREQTADERRQIALPGQGVNMAIGADKAIESITFLNDSVRYYGKLYEGYRGYIPLGLTFADSVGIEENRLFQQSLATYAVHSGYDIGRIQCLSQGNLYTVEIGFIPAAQYFAEKARNPRTSLKRTLFYRFTRVAEKKGKYLNLPLYCGASPGGAFSEGSFSSLADSSYFLQIVAGPRFLANSKLAQQTHTGFELAVNGLFPVSQRISPPLLHTVGLGIASHSYSRLDSFYVTNSNNGGSPSLTSLYLQYGLTLMPYKRLNKRQLIPIAQGLVGGSIDYSNTVVDRGTGDNISTSSAALFYQIGGGLAMIFKSGAMVQLLCTYRRAGGTHFLDYPSLSPDPKDNRYVHVASQAVQSFTVQIGVGFSFGGGD